MTIHILKRFQLVIILFLFALFSFGGYIFEVLQYETRENERLGVEFLKGSKTTTETRVNDEAYYSHKGKDNVDVLTLLKYETTIEQGASGLITSINGNKADDSKKEYWAFYVNGKMAPVGPAEYKTKNGDLIEWKIEKY